MNDTPVVQFCRIVSVAAIFWIPAVSVSSGEQPIDFARDIRPLLSDNCFKCHGPDEGSREADLRLDLRSAAIADRDGSPGIVPGKPEASLIVERMMSDDEDLRMPPVDSGLKLSPAQIELIRRWIAEGAPWQDHWAFVAPQRPKLPRVSHAAWPHHAIDHFIAARLEKEKLAPSAEANKETLIRRVTLDLTGLPPTIAEVDAFLADQSPNAYERLVERLLASPRYGEHMAAAWLDAARYGDTNGYQGDGERTMWPWRDWVIQSLNANMPFDQFTIEQNAGDLLPNPSPSQFLATGFHRNHPLNGEGGRIAEESRVEYVVDRVDTTSTIWLGLTMGCARCHDHKYDPITQLEFYKFYAFFNNVEESGGVDRGGNANPVRAIPSQLDLNAERQLQVQIAQAEKKLHAAVSEEKFAQWTTQQREALTKTAATWLALSPTEFRSEQGQEMRREDSLSLFVSGKNPEKDNYTVTYDLSPGKYTGLRLEALAHESFTAGGLARSNSGNFVLTEFKVMHHPGDGGQPQPVKLLRAEADYEQGGFPISNAFDGNNGTGWAVHHPANMRVNRTGVFVFELPLTVADGDTLVVQYEQQSPHHFHNLGRFRLSATSHDAPSLKLVSPVSPEVATLLSAAPEKLSGEQIQQLRTIYAQTSPELETTRTALNELRARRGELVKNYPEVMVMSERSAPRETFLLERGAYDQPNKAKPAVAGVPASLPPLPEQMKNDRLGLASWLVDGANPLPARVTVNRAWQHFFGTGLVKTSEDFGVQAEPPTHPELLDWLAVEFVENGWDVKALHRAIVTSSTYRQTSRVSPEVLERDPENRLLARGPRVRLSSMAIRDQALALSGLLVEGIGGAPVKPYQPAGVWEDFSLGKIKYQQDHGEKLYRRSLYTYWRRSVGPTMFFDSATRLVCTVRQPRTNTPLHALTTLNDVTFAEASRKFAERMIREGGDSPESRLSWAFRAACARQPSEVELKVLLESYARAKEHFEKNLNSATKLLSVGESPRAKGFAASELAAYSSVASILLNLDEVITKE